jgi:hypothetical protein
MKHHIVATILFCIFENVSQCTVYTKKCSKIAQALVSYLRSSYELKLFKYILDKYVLMYDIKFAENIF